MAPIISYRREDSAGCAGWVHDGLRQEFGGDLLFVDVDSIPRSANFVKLLGEEIAKCDALLASLGLGWLDARDEKGHRRLEIPDDFARHRDWDRAEAQAPFNSPTRTDSTGRPKALVGSRPVSGAVLRCVERKNIA
jgi:hypothetical protein